MKKIKIAITEDDDRQSRDVITEAQANGIIPACFTLQNTSSSALGQGVQSPPSRLSGVTLSLLSAQNGQGAGAPLPSGLLDILSGKQAWQGNH